MQVNYLWQIHLLIYTFLLLHNMFVDSIFLYSPTQQTKNNHLSIYILTPYNKQPDIHF